MMLMLMMMMIVMIMMKTYKRMITGYEGGAEEPDDKDGEDHDEEGSC